MLQTSFYALIGLVGCLILLALWRSGHFFRTLLFSAVTGNLALFSVGWLGTFSGVTLLPNLFTVGTATVLGLPGVISLLLLKLIVKV